MHPLDLQQLVGLLSDGQNYSCAYGSLFFTMFGFKTHKCGLSSSKKLVKSYLASEFQNVFGDHMLLEAACDIDHTMFPYGPNGCSISNLAEKL
jgi:hypothetical protein